MQTVTSIAQMQNIVQQWHKEGITIGFVPTMGYLHEGHLSLVQKAVAENQKTIVSIFVNPTQFGPNEDFSVYPRDLERDAALLEKEKVDIIFAPTADEMYGDSYATYVEVLHLTQGLCGQSRPGHFRGVCTVVLKLFNIVGATRAYFGQKDAQQLAVIQKMAKDLHITTEVIGCPIIRDDDGLAKSSRNIYLSKEERKAALVLSKALEKGRKMIMAGERETKLVHSLIRAEIEKEPLAVIDYVAVVNAQTLQEEVLLSGGVLGAVAVFIGKTRLIDNFMIEVNQ